jgi:Tfp pilus assembly protein PilW
VREAGLSLVELMIAILIISFVMAGVAAFYISHRRVTIQEDLSASLQANLRTGMSRLVDRFRDTGYAVPKTAISTWIPWVSGFDANPKIVDGASGAPDTLSIASCTAQPVATLTAAAAINATSLTVSSTGSVNATNRRLINIGYSENAWVTSVGSGTLAIDSDPTISGTQGLQKAYPIGTVICRVDVDTFSVDATNYRLLHNRNDGAGAQILVDEIQDFQVDTLIAGDQYRITLGARSTQRDPGTNAYVTRRMRSAVTLRN